MHEKIFPSLAILTFVCFTVVAQTQSTASGNSAGKPQMSASYVDGLLKVDQQRFKLTADQMPKAKAALDSYAAKYNAMALETHSIDDYKARLRALDAERIKQYKTFLTPDQYTQMVTTYNKYHPKNQIQP